MNGYLYKCLSPLGDITLASNGEALTGLWFDGQKYFDPALTATYVEKELPVFVETLEWLEQYFNRELPGVPPALQPQGSPFRQAVWNILKKNSLRTNRHLQRHRTKTRPPKRCRAFFGTSCRWSYRT